MTYEIIFVRFRFMSPKSPQINNKIKILFILNYHVKFNRLVGLRDDFRHLRGIYKYLEFRIETNET